jgi:hypothetical protein
MCSRISRLIALSVIFLLALAVSGCGLDLSVTSGEVLFQDDFTRPMSGWDQIHSPLYQADYESGLYTILVHAPRTDAWATPGLDFEDTQIQVEANKIAGPDDNIFGLICRYQDPRNFYFLVVSSDGYAGIGLIKDGRRQLLSGEALLPSAAVRQGQTANVIRGDCIDFSLRLYVNGVLVAESQAAEWRSGDVGLLAGTYDEPSVQIVFDNFSVVQP